MMQAVRLHVKAASAMTGQEKFKLKALIFDVLIRYPEVLLADTDRLTRNQLSHRSMSLSALPRICLLALKDQMSCSAFW